MRLELSSVVNNQEDYDEDEYPDFDLENGSEDCLFFMPMYLYKQPFNGALKLDIDFDPSDHNRLHLVIVRYSHSDEDTDMYGKWHIEKVCKTRREAKDIQVAIESEEYNCDNPVWKKAGAKLDIVEIASVPIED